MTHPRRFALPAALLLAALVPGRALAHCDTLDGPVVGAARLALEKGDVTPVLKWVSPAKEKEIRDALARSLAVRNLGKEAREMADTSFFETLVRVHREGEGAPYTGLKPAGTIDPAFVKGDAALEKGSVDELARELAEHAAAGVRGRFARAAELKKHADESVAAGREFVEAYVVYMHYVEGLVSAIEKGPGAHETHQATAPHAH